MIVVSDPSGSYRTSSWSQEQAKTWKLLVNTKYYQEKRTLENTSIIPWLKSWNSGEKSLYMKRLVTKHKAFFDLFNDSFCHLWHRERTFYFASSSGNAVRELEKSLHVAIGFTFAFHYHMQILAFTHIWKTVCFISRVRATRSRFTFTYL